VSAVTEDPESALRWVRLAKEDLAGKRRRRSAVALLEGTEEKLEKVLKAQVAETPQDLREAVLAVLGSGGSRIRILLVRRLATSWPRVSC
jgi:hypothetical protein